LGVLQKRSDEVLGRGVRPEGRATYKVDVLRTGSRIKVKGIKRIDEGVARAILMLYPVELPTRRVAPP
jgi:hypothetical protein